jgi:hypothetical protein
MDLLERLAGSMTTPALVEQGAEGGGDFSLQRPGRGSNPTLKHFL